MPRLCRPRTYDEDTDSRVIAKARGLPPRPTDGDVPPTCHWTLDRLQQELAKDGLLIKRSQIRRILQQEHIRWQQTHTWLPRTIRSLRPKGGRPASALAEPGRVQHQAPLAGRGRRQAPGAAPDGGRAA
jgi:hypothetical protein